MISVEALEENPDSNVRFCLAATVAKRTFRVADHGHPKYLRYIALISSMTHFNWLLTLTDITL